MYRKLPVVISAEQFDGTDGSFHTICKKFALNPVSKDRYETPKGEQIHKKSGGDFFVQTLEGKMEVSKGDFVIRGVQGEFYPCKPEIFEKTYERVEN